MRYCVGRCELDWRTGFCKGCQSDKCGVCGKLIDDEEYVVNWGSCSDCLTASYKEYLCEKVAEAEVNLAVDFTA